MEQARTDLPNLDTEVRRGEFSGLKKWLNDKIHAHGQRWRARDLCRRVTGRELSPAPLMRYLKGKYAEFYGL
jgi:carboxypeptidase Taq